MTKALQQIISEVFYPRQPRDKDGRWKTTLKSTTAKRVDDRPYDHIIAEITERKYNRNQKGEFATVNTLGSVRLSKSTDGKVLSELQGDEYVVSDGKKVARFKMNKFEQNFVEKTGLKVYAGKHPELTVKANRQKNTTRRAYYIQNEHAIVLEQFDDSLSQTAGVFYHEFGHSVDYYIGDATGLGTLSGMTSVFFKPIVLDRVAVVKNRLMQQPELAKEVIAFNLDLDKLATGKTQKITGKDTKGNYISNFKLPKSYRDYVYSQQELFAEGYSQWRMMPEQFTKDAPLLADAYKELSKR